MILRRRVNLYYFAGLLALAGAMVLLRWGHGNLHDFAEGGLLGIAIPLMLAAMRRASKCVNSARIGHNETP